MSKSPGGISKDKRKRTLLEILERWGKLNFDQLSKHMESATGIDASAAKRTLYRDLEELVNEGVLHESRFAPDGSEIEAYDSDLHKNTVCHWFVTHLDHSPIGSGIIQKHGGQLLVSSRLKNCIRVQSGSEAKNEPTKDKLGLFFSLGNDFIFLDLEKENIPYTIVFSRVPNPHDPKISFSMLEEEFGKRLISLELPIPSISALKSPNRLGHCHLVIEKLETFVITDHHSTNGTQLAKIARTEAIERIKRTSISGYLTLTSTAFQALEKQAPWQKLEAGKSQESSMPALIAVSKSFHVLIL